MTVRLIDFGLARVLAPQHAPPLPEGSGVQPPARISNVESGVASGSGSGSGSGSESEDGGMSPGSLMRKLRSKDRQAMGYADASPVRKAARAGGGRRVSVCLGIAQLYMTVGRVCVCASRVPQVTVVEPEVQPLARTDSGGR